MGRQVLRLAPLLATGAALSLLLLGCGTKTAPPQPAAVSAPAATAAQSLSPLARRGRGLFMEEAGPPSCMVCHGKEGSGKPELATPDIRGKTEADVRKAIQNGELMRSVYSSLTDRDIEALVAYLEYLATQK